MSIGSLAAVCAGLSYPIFQVGMGRMMNAINEDPSTMTESVSEILTFCLYWIW